MWGRIDSPPLLTLDTGEALELLGTLKSMESCTLEAAAELYQVRHITEAPEHILMKPSFSKMLILIFEKLYFVHWCRR